MPISIIARPVESGVRYNTFNRSNAQALCMPWRRFVLLLLVAFTFTAAHAQSYYYVDCSGTNPADFPTIGAALAVAGPNSYILITGTCNENVRITNASNLNVGAFYGSTAVIHGNAPIAAMADCRSS